MWRSRSVRRLRTMVHRSRRRQRTRTQARTQGVVAAGSAAGGVRCGVGIRRLLPGYDVGLKVLFFQPVKLLKLLLLFVKCRYQIPIPLQFGLADPRFNVRQRLALIKFQF